MANPSGVVADVAALADVAHAENLPLVIDSTLATPYLCRPIEHGADIVVHSATKFIGGHGTSIGGVVVEAGPSTGATAASPTSPSRCRPTAGWFWENFGEYAFCTKLRVEQLRDMGASMSPFNAFLLLQGLETLPLRMEAHVANAARVAAWLEEHPAVSWVRYAGLPSSPFHALAQRYLPRGRGRSSPSAWRAAGPPACLHRVAGDGQPSGQHRRRQDAGDPPGVDDAPAAVRRGAGGLRRPPT